MWNQFVPDMNLEPKMLTAMCDLVTEGSPRRFFWASGKHGKHNLSNVIIIITYHGYG